MYIDHFGLVELPFSISPDPRFLYLTLSTERPWLKRNT